MRTGVIALLGLACLFVGWILTLVLPGIRLIAWGVLALGAISVLVAFVIDYRRVGGALVSRRGRFSTGTTLMVSVFVGIILLANAISIGNFHRFDVTGLSEYTLTSQTKGVLEGMDTPVESVLFTVPGDLTGEYLQNLLNEYQNFTDQLSLELIDPEQKPDQARLYGVSQYPAMVFEGEVGRRIVRTQDIVSFTAEGDLRIEAEHAFTSALLEVTGAVQKKVYFLSGHGENSIFSTGADGYSTAREGLLDNLYKVDALDIRAAGDIPDDCTVLAIAGPQQPLTSREVDIIRRYLEDDGWAIILVNPNPPDEIRQLVSVWGLDIRDGIIIDEESYAEPNKESPRVPASRNYFSQFGMLRDTYFPGATALLPREDAPEDMLVLPLVWTSRQSWLEKDFGGQERKFDEGVDEQGPVAIGVLMVDVAAQASAAEEETIKGTRLIVYGDSDFASNRRFQDGDNGNLFLTSVNILTAGTELISMDRKFLQTRRLIIGPEAERFITISSIGLLPLVVLVVGAYIWWRRR